MKIIGLEEYGISDKDLTSKYAGKKFRVNINFSNYPDVESLKPLTPKQRRLLVYEYLRNQFKVVKAYYPSSDFKIKGTRLKPRGIIGQLTGQQLAELQSNIKTKDISVEEVEGLKKKDKRLSAEPEGSTLTYIYSIKGLFVAQFNDVDATVKSRLTEERILLFKAQNWKEAIKKARVEFEKYSQKGIFTSSYHFVTWKFLKILDVYDMGLTDLKSEINEVYSIWKQRQLRASDYDKHIIYENF